MYKSFQTVHALGFLSAGESANNCWAETTLGNEGNAGRNIKSFKNTLFQWLICLTKKRWLLLDL